MSGLDPVAQPASPNRRMMAFFTEVVILAIISRLVLSNLDDDADFVGQIIEVGRFSDTGQSARLFDVSSHSALGTGVVISSSTASNDRCPTAGPQAGVWVLDTSVIRLLFRTFCSGSLTT